MSVEEVKPMADVVIRIADALVFETTGRHLTEAEITVLRGSWRDQSYEDIAEASRYSLNYLKRDVGPKMWRLLSEVLGEKVSKANFHSATLERSPEWQRIQRQESLHSDWVPDDRAPELGSGRSRLVDKDWGEAVDTSQFFYGRTEELTLLQEWIQTEGCRLVALLGRGGVGKTTLSVKLADSIKDDGFEYFIWRSLRHAPKLHDLLADLITFITKPNSVTIPEDTNAAISLLLRQLRLHRCLIVLDSIESLLKPQDLMANYRDQHREYGELFSRLGSELHQSCILVTSREKPKELTWLEGEALLVRSLSLGGLDRSAAAAILDCKGMGSEAAAARSRLIELYAGNPSELKVAATAIKELFNNSVQTFLDQTPRVLVFDRIGRMIGRQFDRLSESEKTVIYWLALHREPISLGELRQLIVSSVLQIQLIDALYGLERRSLIEKVADKFTLQPTVMEWVTLHFIEQITHEIQTGDIHALKLLNTHALIQAQAKDYLRNHQMAEVLYPIANHLLCCFESREKIKDHLLTLLANLRDQFPAKPGYVGGNCINLLGALKGELRGLDFSHLTCWQAYLPILKLPQVNFTGADLSKTLWTETLGNVLSIAYSPNGRWLAAGDDHAQVYVWNLETGGRSAILNGHESWIRAIAFSPDSRTLASGSHDQTVRIWDVETGQCIRSFQDFDTRIAHHDWVRSLAFSSDGQTLVTASDDHTVKFWDALTGQLNHQLENFTDRVRTVAFSHDSQMIATGCDDYTVELWDRQTQQKIATLVGHQGWVRSVAFSPDGRYLASGSDDRSVKLWDLQTYACRTTFTGHDNWVRAVAFNSDGTLLASGSDDQTVRIWDVETGELKHESLRHAGMVWSVTFSPDGQTLASGGDDQTVRQWEVSTGRCLSTFQGYTAGVRAIAFHPSDDILASGTNAGTVNLWNLQQGVCQKVLAEHTGRVWTVAFSPDGKLLASGSDDQTIRLWNTETGDIRLLAGHTNYVRSLCFSPDSGMLASSGHDRCIRLWNVQTGECIRTIRGHTHWVRSLTFSPNGQMLASSGDEQVIRLWQVSSGRAIATLLHHNHRVRSLAFHPSGAILASASDDKTIVLWDMTAQTVMTVLKDHTLGVQSVAFSPMGDRLASGSDDGQVKVWDWQQAICLATFKEHRHWVRAVAFSPDGSRLASGGQDEKIFLWDMQTYTAVGYLRTDRPYEEMDISHVTGLTETQKSTLKALGAIDSTVLQSC